jgi:hypothetical protein
MQTLKAIELFSGTLPGGETVTLHTGNERAFDDADAQWLLAEYPERFERVEAAVALSTDKNARKTRAASAEDETLVKKPPVDVPPEVEKFGAQAKRTKG